MKVLILSAAILASALAAPSSFLVPAAQVLAIPAATPTIPPGDIEAAAINAKVKAEDEARALADQAKLLEDMAKQQAEINILLQKDEETKMRDAMNLRADQTFWEQEDKKWQQYDAVNSAHAELDGSVANSADGIAKFAVKSAVFIPPAPVLAPVVPPVVYATPGIVAPDIKAYSALQSEKQESMPEKLKESEPAPAPAAAESTESPLKSGPVSQPEDPEKTAEDYKKALLEMYKIAEENNKKAAEEALKMTEENFKQYTEGIKAFGLNQLENAAQQIALKTAEKESGKNLVAAQILASSPIAFSPTFAYDPFYASLTYFKPTAYSATYSQIQNHIPPTFYKTVW